MSSTHVPGHIHMPYVGIIGDEKSKNKQEEKESWKIYSHRWSMIELNAQVEEGYYIE